MAKWYPPGITTDAEKIAYDKETEEYYTGEYRRQKEYLRALLEKHENDPYVEGTPVDLSRADAGICERFNKRWYCPIVRLSENGNYLVRIESGWYEEYTKEGISVRGGKGNITFFAPCSPFSPQARGLKSETNP